MAENLSETVEKIRELHPLTPIGLKVVAGKRMVHPNRDYALYAPMDKGEEITPMLVAEVFEQVATDVYVDAKPTAEIIALLVNNAPALLDAAEYGLKEREIFEYVCGDDYLSSRGLMVFGMKAHKWLKSIKEDSRFPNNNIILNAAKSFGLLEVE
jgi:hypothetical protein